MKTIIDDNTHTPVSQVLQSKLSWHSAKRVAQSCLASTVFIIIGTGLAWADATQTGSALQVTGDHQPDSMEIEVGPIAGQVTLFGVIGVPDGQIFSGVSDITVNTLSGDDSIKVVVGSADVSLSVGTASGNDTVSIDMMTPGGASQASALLAFDTGFGNDTVEIKVASFASDFVFVTSFARAFTPLDNAKIEFLQEVAGRVTMELAANQPFTLDNFSLVAKGPAVFGLNGEIRSMETKIEIDGDAAGNVQLTGEVFPSNIEYMVKGSLNGSPGVIANSAFRDSLKLLVEGGIIGSPIVDGHHGFGDSCDVSPGVLVVDCDGP